MKKRTIILFPLICIFFLFGYQNKASTSEGLQEEKATAVNNSPLKNQGAATANDDWPQFLGPNRNSTSSVTGILRKWPAKGPEVLWTTDVKSGYGGPVIKNGKVYLLDREGREKDTLRCLDLNTGKELWSYTYSSPGTVSSPGSRSVPIVNDTHVYSCGQNGDLYCIDIITHKPVWNKNVWTDFGGAAIPMWGITQCPLIYGNLLILASQAPDAGVVAYNKLTGAVVWKTPNLGNISYASPSMAHIEGQDFIVMVQSKTNTFTDRGKPITSGNVAGIEPSTGAVLWNFDKWECIISVPGAVDAGNNKLLLTGGYDLGAMMIEVRKDENGKFTATELYRTIEFGDHTKPPIVYNGYFYAQNSTNSRRDGLTCMSLKGEIMWKTKGDPGFDKGSMILADGLLLATDGATKIYLIEPDPKGYKPLVSAELLTRGQNWAPMALSGGKLLIKDQSQMKCIKVTK